MTLSGFDSEAAPTYPARGFPCLDCVVPGECNPSSVLCLWRADRSRPPDEREAQLLSAIDWLSGNGRSGEGQAARRRGCPPQAHRV